MIKVKMEGRRREKKQERNEKEKSGGKTEVKRK